MRNNGRYRVASRFDEGSSFRLRCAIAVLGPALLVGLCGVLLAASWPLLLLFPLLSIPAFFGLKYLPSTLVIARDGIRVRWLIATKFVRFTDIERVSAERGPAHDHGAAEYVLLHLRDGSLFRIVMRSRAQRASTIAALIRASSGAATRDLPLLPDGVRKQIDGPLARSFDTLRSLGEPSSHRRWAADLDALWAVVEHPEVRRADRAAAAVILAGSLDGATADRLRTVAQSLADCRLRDLLRHLADQRTSDARQACTELDEEAG